ncbi:hypothetical protein BJV77DRAFT_1070315 [Russula vinacea]|nr:hypothetical protein BJV77DRAFT_1070315 [Russula vinacea]
MSRFVDRIEASVYSLSSLRTIPAAGGVLFPVHTGGGRTPKSSAEMIVEVPTRTPPPPPTPICWSVFPTHLVRNLWNNSTSLPAFHTRCQTRRTDIMIRAPVLAARLARVNHPIYHSRRLRESSHPSPYSADAVAVFQAPLNKADDALYFDTHVKHRGIHENRIQVVFAEAADSTSTRPAPVQPLRALHPNRAASLFP